MRRLLVQERGVAAVEFALVAPAFLMFVFLIIDGSRMLFTKQALNELAMATARCAALKATGCDTTANAQAWARARALRSAGMLIGTSATVEYPPLSPQCNNQASMVRATISVGWKRGAFTLLPQSVAPATLSSIYCFPVAS